MINDLYKSLINKEKYNLVEGKIISVFNDNLKSNTDAEIKARQHIIKYADIPSLQNFYNFKRTNTTSVKFLDLKPVFLCYELELLFRYLNYVNKDNKKWFFSNIETYLYSLENLPTKTTVSRKFLN
jgi:hypothetical protein